MLYKTITILVFGIGAVAAAEMAGTVSATKGLQLNGQTVPVAGTKQWPVNDGDSLKSDAAPVVLTMKDGSRVVLGASSQAKLEAGTIRLVSGTMQYQLAQRSTLQVAVKGEAVANRAGVVSTVTAAPVAPMVSTTVQTENVLPISRRKP